jgi:hypothetical protein
MLAFFLVSNGRIYKFIFSDNVCILFIYRFHEVISTEWLSLLSTSIKFKYGIIKNISHYSIDAPGQGPKVKEAQW